MSLNEWNPLKDIISGNETKNAKNAINCLSAGGTKRRKRDMEEALERLFDYAGKKTGGTCGPSQQASGCGRDKDKGEPGKKSAPSFRTDRKLQESL